MHGDRVLFSSVGLWEGFLAVRIITKLLAYLCCWCLISAKAHHEQPMRRNFRVRLQHQVRPELSTTRVLVTLSSPLL